MRNSVSTLVLYRADLRLSEDEWCKLNLIDDDVPINFTDQFAQFAQD